MFWTEIWYNCCCERKTIRNHKCNEVENAFPIAKLSRLVSVHTDSHHNDYNKMNFTVSYVW